MRIEKALQKAKELRQQNQDPEGGRQPAARKRPAARTRQWTPPVYAESNAVKIDFKKAEENHCLLDGSGSMEADAVKVLRTQLLHRTQEKGWRTVMITSVLPGEGKTLTAINLAFAMAREHQKTVALVDCDLRNQSIYRYLGIDSRRGLADYLLDDLPLKDIILWPGVEKMTLISGSRMVADSTEIIGSPKMQALVAEMKSRYPDRYVFYDFPPVLVSADVLAFTPFVDCILMVIEAGRTSARDVKKALAMIPEEKLLGFVLNKQKLPKRAYYGYY